MYAHISAIQPCAKWIVFGKISTTDDLMERVRGKDTLTGNTECTALAYDAITVKRDMLPLRKHTKV